ncbi:hypothetical protein GXW71_18995 [Roseomonas hellenica]|uniref:Uncharacterized protein n=1 Tax=Plastoroseomonas hellenica TaxID=2687306 RepID=A0ABS5F1L6_9PROT|nr:hypothetical protein [Plastoroseomonas hellenica]MBR0666455.1 hypothetical protein [Plastoroseomonas hellenica]
MVSDDDDLGDARSREANRSFRPRMERGKSENPAFAYAPRWAPTGNWRMSWFDRVVVAFGIGIILMVLGMWAFGAIS